MKMKIVATALVMATSVCASFAQARGSSSGVMFTANVFMYNNSEEVTTGSTTSKGDSKSSIYDIKGGYLTGDGLYFGGLYTMRNAEAGNSSYDGKNLGVSLGYVGVNGFFVMGHYILSAEYGPLKEGTGIQGDFGYITNVTGSFLVGVELTYRSIEYKKDEDSAGVDKHKKDELLPMLTVGFVF
jgi:hypothetical protein